MSYRSVLLLLFSFVFIAPATPQAKDEAPPLSSKARGGGSAAAAVDNIITIHNEAFQTEEYIVKKGDWLAKILREKGLANERNLPELLSVLKRLNPSVPNLDLIEPGDKIIILAKVGPGSGSVTPAPRHLTYERYTVKQGDTLIRLATQRYTLSKAQFMREYLRLFAECNPSIKNPNELSVGQIIHLPDYPPTSFQSAGRLPAVKDLKAPTITDGLGAVISRMGEEWVQSGEYIIPTKSGGHINLKADAYPIVRLNSGSTVIVDIHHGLPEKMVKMLETTRSSNQVVRLSAKDDLGSALEKILSACNYPKVLKGKEPLILESNIPTRITGDLIVTTSATGSEKGSKYIVINLMHDRDQALPSAIKDYLKLAGVDVIEYPAPEEAPSGTGALSTVQTATDPKELVKTVLNLRGLPFTTQVDIPAYTTHNRDFTLMVQANFYLTIWGRQYIIDLGGLTPDVVSLLKENGISILSLAPETEPLEIVSRILEFMDIRFKPGPHSFVAHGAGKQKNVTLTLSGITFQDHNGASVLATPMNLPPELVVFLSQRGYRLLFLAPFVPPVTGSG